MKEYLNKLKDKWYIFLVGILLAVQALVFLVVRENSYIQIHDNLDLFMAHYQMMKKEGAFFAQNVKMPMLHGIDRDLLGSEFLLYNVLYIVLPNFWAYIVGYGLKIAIGIFSFVILAKDIYKDNYEKYRPLIIVVATAFGLIPVFPTYGIAFTSVPLIVWLLRRLYYTDNIKARLILYVGVFAYPLVSYFSYHGFFILCYMSCALIILWIRDRRFPKCIFTSCVVLSLGYILWEYRLFRAMLFDDTVTIRTTMDHGDISFLQALKAALDEFIMASFHSQDSHTYIVLGVCLTGLIIINAGYIKRKEYRRMITDSANLVTGWMIFNVLIFGFYQYEPFRKLIETIVPKLTGFEFARTAFFNTFLWYALLLIIMIRMYDKGKTTYKMFANVIVTLALLVVMFAPAMYNDFYYTCYNQAYIILKHKDTSTVNYKEFYSEELFEEIKSDIGYKGQWSAAYGMHPAILNYNDIASVDGYLGMYSQEYKEKWAKVVGPALDGSPDIKAYFDSWGARVALFSGDDENSYEPKRVLELNDTRLMVNIDELKSLDCVYIFSRVEFSNADEAGVSLLKSYSNDTSPYTIYVYTVD